jgi:hypothetical protein
VRERREEKAARRRKRILTRETKRIKGNRRFKWYSLVAGRSLGKASNLVFSYTRRKYSCDLKLCIPILRFYV